MRRRPDQYPDGVGREPYATIMDYHERENRIETSPKEEFKIMLNNSIEDESSAGSNYDRMSELADKSDMPVGSALLKMIAEQERTHNKVLKKLRHIV